MESLTKELEKIKQNWETNIHIKEVQITRLLSLKAQFQKLIKNNDAAVLQALSFIDQAGDSLNQINNELEKILKEEKVVLTVDESQSSAQSPAALLVTEIAPLKEQFINQDKERDKHQLIEMEKNVVDHTGKITKVIDSISRVMEVLPEAQEALKQYKYRIEDLGDSKSEVS